MSCIYCRHGDCVRVHVADRKQDPVCVIPSVVQSYLATIRSGFPRSLTVSAWFLCRCLRACSSPGSPRLPGALLGDWRLAGELCDGAGNPSCVTFSWQRLSKTHHDTTSLTSHLGLEFWVVKSQKVARFHDGPGKGNVHTGFQSGEKGNIYFEDMWWLSL